MFEQLQSHISQLQQKVDALSPSHPTQYSTEKAAPQENTRRFSEASSESSSFFSAHQTQPQQSQQAQPQSPQQLQQSPPPQQPQSQQSPQPQVEEKKSGSFFGSTEEVAPKPRAESTPVQSNSSNDLPKQRTSTLITSNSTSSIKPANVMEGWLHKLGGWNKTKWESRYFTCDGIELMYHASQQVFNYQVVTDA